MHSREFFNVGRLTNLCYVNMPLKQKKFFFLTELTVTLESDPGLSRFNCSLSLSSYNDQVEVLIFQIGDEVLSCNVDPVVPCSFQDDVTGIHATDFNRTTNSFSVAIDNITAYNGSSVSCSAAVVADSIVVESNRITILILKSGISQ